MGDCHRQGQRPRPQLFVSYLPAAFCGGWQLSARHCHLRRSLPLGVRHRSAVTLAGQTGQGHFPASRAWGRIPGHSRGRRICSGDRPAPTDNRRTADPFSARPPGDGSRPGPEPGRLPAGIRQLRRHCAPVGDPDRPGGFAPPHRAYRPRPLCPLQPGRPDSGYRRHRQSPAALGCPHRQAVGLPPIYPQQLGTLCRLLPRRQAPGRGGQRRQNLPVGLDLSRFAGGPHQTGAHCRRQPKRRELRHHFLRRYGRDLGHRHKTTAWLALSFRGTAGNGRGL